MHNISILYILFYYFSWGNILDEFTNTVNPNSKLFHLRHLLVNLNNPKHLPLLNEQQRMYLLQDTNIKTIQFIPKIPSRMMQPSQKMTTYSLARQPKTIITFQQFKHLIIIHNVFLPQLQVDWFLTHLRYYLRLVNNICVLWRKVNLTRPPGILNKG